MKNIGSMFALLALSLAFLGNAQSPPFAWVRQAGGTERARSSKIAVDNEGNCYVVGSFEGTASFGPTNLISEGSFDVFVVKYDTAGSFEWVWQASGPDDDTGWGIGVDGSGNCYTSGTFKGSAWFGPTNLVSRGSYDGFLIKLNPAGEFQWVQQAGGDGGDDDNAAGLAVDPIGNCYVVGWFYGTAVFGPTNLVSMGADDIFCAKYNNEGILQWVRQAGGTAYDGASGIAVDEAGNCYISGNFQGLAYFGPTNLNSRQYDDAFFAKYDRNGVFQWVRQQGGTGTDLAYSICVDKVSNIFVTGFFQDTATFQQTNLVSIGKWDVYIAKYDAMGILDWVRQVAGPENDFGYNVTSDEASNCYITGFLTGDAYFGFTNGIILGSNHVYVAKYDSVGDLQWLVQGSGMANYYNHGGVALDFAGNCFVNGSFSGVGVFGGTNLTSAGDSDAFIAKIASAPPCIPHPATATATVIAGTVTEIRLTDKGCGYTNAPIVRIVGGGGSGAMSVATITGGYVTRITLLDGGIGYTNAPRVRIASPPFMPSLGIAVSRVKVTLHVVLGRNYVLEASPDLINWNQVGTQFTAEDELIEQEFEVSVTGRFFRIREVP